MPPEKSVAIRLCTKYMVSGIPDHSTPCPLHSERHRDDLSVATDSLSRPLCSLNRTSEVLAGTELSGDVACRFFTIILIAIVLAMVTVEVEKTPLVQSRASAARSGVREAFRSSFSQYSTKFNNPRSP